MLENALHEEKHHDNGQALNGVYNYHSLLGDGWEDKEQPYVPPYEEDQVERKLGSDGVAQVDGPGYGGHMGVDIHSTEDTQVWIYTVQRTHRCGYTHVQRTHGCGYTQ